MGGGGCDLVATWRLRYISYQIHGNDLEGEEGSNLLIIQTPCLYTMTMHCNINFYQIKKKNSNDLLDNSDLFVKFPLEVL